LAGKCRNHGLRLATLEPSFKTGKIWLVLPPSVESRGALYRFVSRTIVARPRVLVLAVLLGGCGATAVGVRSAQADEVPVPLRTVEVQYSTAPGAVHLGFFPRIDGAAQHVDRVVRPLKYVFELGDAITSAVAQHSGAREVDPLFKPGARSGFLGFVATYALLDVLGDALSRRSHMLRLAADTYLFSQGVVGTVTSAEAYSAAIATSAMCKRIQTQGEVCVQSP
jgi:hypothetical protein